MNYTTNIHYIAYYLIEIAYATIEHVQERRHGQYHATQPYIKLYENTQHAMNTTTNTCISIETKADSACYNITND